MLGPEAKLKVGYIHVSLDTLQKDEIGQYDSFAVGGFQSFSINIISTALRRLGTCCSLMVTLNKYVSITKPLGGNSFSILGEILSIPGAFLGFIFFISLNKSCGVTSLTGDSS